MIRSLAFGLALLSMIGGLSLGAGRAGAEGFFDLYVGGSFTDSNPTLVSASAPGIEAVAQGSRRFEDSVLAGFRGGGYFPGIPATDAAPTG